MRRFDRPPRHPLGETQRTVVTLIVSIGFIVIGVAFAMGSNIHYAAGDYRGSVWFAIISGGLAIGIGGLLLP